MKRIIPVIFVLVAGCLAFLFFSQNLFVQKNSFTRAKVVIPMVENAEDEKNADYDEDTAGNSFILLANDETLLSTVEADLDGDGNDDQINIVKTFKSPYIMLVIGLFDSVSGTYQRTNYIATNVVQVRTFACTGMDVTGDHKNELVYQGVLENGKMILKILSGHKNQNNAFVFSVIGDFESEGTVFVQQEGRSEAYEMNQSAGVSYPVWVYSSEEGSSDQIQTMYGWNESSGTYEEVRTVRIAGSRIAARELAKIQDGTVSSFGKFLDGLWYKTENSGTRIRYLFFDYANSEIIFQSEDSEEVYSWLNSNLRRSGIYFSAVNKSIENLQRRFDISLVNLDEISVRIQDDVRMMISESNVWDGNYKKFVSNGISKEKKDSGGEVIDTLKSVSSWQTSDGTVINFSENNYNVTSKDSYDSGRYTRNKISESTLIQFRSEKKLPYFAGSYLPSFFKTTVQSKDSKGRISEKVSVDKETVTLQSVVLSPDGFYTEQIPPLVLKKYIPPKEEEEISPEEDVNGIAVSEEPTEETKYPLPKLSVRITPKYFSPDGDGEGDNLYINLGAENEPDSNGKKATIERWSFTVYDPENGRQFWTQTGNASVTPRIVWNGRSSNGEIVQSATDYPYEFKVTDSNKMSNTVKGFIQVDVLVVRDGDRLKMQVPSIIFRSDHADFKSMMEVQSDPGWDGESKGLDQHTIDNNNRVLSRIADILKKFRDYNVTIEGNANNLTGSEKEELEVKQLSEDRAKFVRNWLIQEGVSASHLTAVGNGSKNPVTNRIENRWQNRRVEFILKK